MVVYVNNVYITVLHRRMTTREETASFAKRKNVFIINISLCFYTKAAKREKLACRETCGEHLLPVPPGLQVFAFSGVPCV